MESGEEGKVVNERGEKSQTLEAAKRRRGVRAPRANPRTTCMSMPPCRAQERSGACARLNAWPRYVLNLLLAQKPNDVTA